MTRGMDIRLPNVRTEGDHGLVQEDQGELTRVCCCAAHINDVRITIDIIVNDETEISLVAVCW